MRSFRRSAGERGGLHFGHIRWSGPEWARSRMAGIPPGPTSSADCGVRRFPFIHQCRFPWSPLPPGLTGEGANGCDEDTKPGDAGEFFCPSLPQEWDPAGQCGEGTTFWRSGRRGTAAAARPASGNRLMSGGGPASERKNFTFNEISAIHASSSGRNTTSSIT